MKTLKLAKAQGVDGKIVRDATIIINRGLPDFSAEDQTWAAKTRRLYQHDAQKLAKCLADHLPGGTMHELLVELLRRKQCLFRVPDGEPQNKTVTLTFHPQENPDDRLELRRALTATEAYLALQELDQWLRNAIKHENRNELQPAREQLHQKMQEQGISFDDME